jgi:hypothetical protein
MSHCKGYFCITYKTFEELDGPAVSALRFIYYLEHLRASEVTLSRWSRLYLQSLAPTKMNWARVVGYSPFSLCVIRKVGLCPSSGDINRLMMMIKLFIYLFSGAAHHWKRKLKTV